MCNVLRLIVFCASLLSTNTMVALQYLTSPCPEIFQYEQDTNGGGIVGAMVIRSLDDNVVKLNIEMSVGNRVDNFNGEIVLVSPRNQVADDLAHGRPIRYKLYFPRWERIPPRITKILVNDRLICSGPKIPSEWVSILTTINLQHTLTLKVTTLQLTPPDSGLIKNTNPFLSSNDFPPRKNPFDAVDNPFLKNDNFNGGGSKNVNSNGGFLGNRPPQNNQFSTTPDAIDNPFLKNDNFNGGGPKDVNSNTGLLGNRPPQNFDLGFKPPSVQEPSGLYSRNPFLNKNASTVNPSRKEPNFNLIPAVTVPKTPSGGGEGGSPEVTSSPPENSQNVPSRDLGGLEIPFADICGLPVVSNPLIVKGFSVPRGAFPWLSAMFHVKDSGLEYKCSGSLISTKHIVTAAHCVKDEASRIRPEDLLFVLGKLNIKRWTVFEGERMIEAEKIHVHPDYKPRVSDADIAIILLNGEITFNSLIRPICLWSENSNLKDVVGSTGKVVGWGKDEDGRIKAEQPKQISIPIVSQKECLLSEETFSYVVSNRTFCAGKRDGSGPCNGDSGSGFIMKRRGRWELRGVVSISTFDTNKQTCDLSNYVVFTDASKHKEWILSFIT